MGSAMTVMLRAPRATITSGPTEGPGIRARSEDLSRNPFSSTRPSLAIHPQASAGARPLPLPLVSQGGRLEIDHVAIPNRGGGGRHWKANCTSSGFETHSRGWQGSIWGIPVEA